MILYQQSIGLKFTYFFIFLLFKLKTKRMWNNVFGKIMVWKFINSKTVPEEILFE